MFQEPNVDRKWAKRTLDAQLDERFRPCPAAQTDDLLQMNPFNRFRYFRLAHKIKICNLESLWTFLKYENIIFQKEFRKYLIWLIWLSQNQNSENHSTCRCLFCSSPNLFFVSRYPPIWSDRGALIVRWHQSKSGSLLLYICHGHPRDCKFSGWLRSHVVWEANL